MSEQGNDMEVTEETHFGDESPPHGEHDGHDTVTEHDLSAANEENFGESFEESAGEDLSLEEKLDLLERGEFEITDVSWEDD
jgi:hypothetical protein